MTDCPKSQCVQDSRIRTLEVLQGQMCGALAELKKDVKAIREEVVGENGDGIRGRIIAIETQLVVTDRWSNHFWKIFGIGVACVAVIVAIVK